MSPVFIPVPLTRKRWQHCRLISLTLRASETIDRFTVVDPVPLPTYMQRADIMRARDINLFLGVVPRKKMTTFRKPSSATRLELSDVCKRIDLISSSSLDATASVLAQSAVLTWPIISVGPPIVVLIFAKINEFGNRRVAELLV